jgi:putative ABC transport system ATP-binding protein
MQPALAIAGLKFAYTPSPLDDAWVVDVPSFELARGEQALLTARSGRGKSTLLYLIAGLLEPSRGEVRVDGQLVHALGAGARDRFRGRAVGMIFQTFNLLHGFSALENVMAALLFSTIPPREHRDRARALLARLGIARPDAAVDDLSVGQQQRVAVARAVACDPVLVLADEPTASLDPENAAQAMDLIQSACKERNAALLCVSHDPSMAARFGRRHALDGALEAGSVASSKG